MTLAFKPTSKNNLVCFCELNCQCFYYKEKCTLNIRKDFNVRLDIAVRSAATKLQNELCKLCNNSSVIQLCNTAL